MGKPLEFLVVGVASVVTTYAMTGTSAVWRVCVEKLARLGDWSFTLYAFHLPVVILIIAAIGRVRAVLPLCRLTSVVLVYIVGAAACAASRPTYFLGQSQTETVRRALMAPASRDKGTP